MNKGKQFSSKSFHSNDKSEPISPGDAGVYGSRRSRRSISMVSPWRIVRNNYYISSVLHHMKVIMYTLLDFLIPTLVHSNFTIDIWNPIKLLNGECDCHSSFTPYHS